MFIKDFGLKTGENPEILGVAFEAAMLGSDLVERAFAVVAVGRVPDVVRQTAQLDQVEVAAEPDRHSAPDLRHFQRMCQPGARGVSFARADDLCLVGEPAQRGAVQYPSPIPGELGAVLTLGAWQTRSLRRFVDPPLPVEVAVGVLLVRDHRGTVCQGTRTSGCA